MTDTPTTDDTETLPEFNAIQRAKKGAFLAEYGKLGNITKAAEEVEMDRGTHYVWLEADDQYAKDFAAAQSRYIEKLEAEADRRATEGVEEPVFHQGTVCGHKKRYSDTLLIFRLKGLAPERYRERTDIKHDHKHSGTVRVIEDDDWYGNADRLPAAADGPSEADPA